jgi:hypothetical protein
MKPQTKLGFRQIGDAQIGVRNKQRSHVTTISAERCTLQVMLDCLNTGNPWRIFAGYPEKNNREQKKPLPVFS